MDTLSFSRFCFTISPKQDLFGFQDPPFLISDDPDHKLKEGIRVDAILSGYIFDRKLRLLVLDAVERIEVAVRATISYSMSEKYCPHWYLNPKLFKTNFKHNDLILKIKYETGYKNPKKQNDSCRRYFRTYNDTSLPPIWIVAEVLSIGTWSNIFTNLRSHKDRKRISDQYNLHFNIMTSWLHSLTYLRNLCAHHARLWNRKFTVKPKIANNYRKHLQNNDSFYAQAAVLNVFLSIIASSSRWQYRLLDLLRNNQDISLESMGFPMNWHEDPFWGIF